MSAGHNAENGEPLDGANFPDRPAGIATPPALSPAERLDYIAAMVHELKIMSLKANCQTLAGLLELAHREAVRQRRAAV